MSKSGDDDDAIAIFSALQFSLHCSFFCIAVFLLGYKVLSRVRRDAKFYKHKFLLRLFRLLGFLRLKLRFLSFSSRGRWIGLVWGSLG